MADFFVDLDVLCAPSIKAGGWASVQSPPFPDFLSGHSLMGVLELLVGQGVLV
ncbi:MAG: hypothetical protein NT053_12195 [Cyanobacteria bacterium]|nr:hypothetical protein [Cyanobacteriota bacterium]